MLSDNQKPSSAVNYQLILIQSSIPVTTGTVYSIGVLSTVIISCNRLHHTGAAPAPRTHRESFLIAGVSSSEKEWAMKKSLKWRIKAQLFIVLSNEQKSNVTGKDINSVDLVWSFFFNYVETSFTLRETILRLLNKQLNFLTFSEMRQDIVLWLVHMRCFTF